MALQFSVEWGAVAASVVVTMVLGLLWYGTLFGRQWVAFQGWSPAQIKKAGESGNQALLLSLLTWAVSAVVISMLTASLGASGLLESVAVALSGWVLVAAFYAMTIAFGSKKWGLWALDLAYQFTCFLAIGVVLAVL